MEYVEGNNLKEVLQQGRPLSFDEIGDIVAQVVRGHVGVGAARSAVNAMTMRQNNWTLGAYCESYCRVVTTHHTLEDTGIFPHLRATDPDAVPIIDRLEEEHETIADLLERVDQALVALVSSEEDGIAGVERAIGILNDALLSHFSYEERELIEPLARLGFY